MFESITESIELIKRSFGVLMQEKKLLLFPLISGIIMIGVFAVFLLPSILIQSNFGEVGFYAILAAFYFASYFLIIFFNTALIYAVKDKLDGKPVSIMESISFAFTKIFNIIIWAAISATVGLILSFLRDQANKRGGITSLVGSLVVSMIGAAWNIATYFVVPIMVVENVNPLEAIKRSVGLIKRTWGEQVVGGIGMGILFLVLYVLGIGAVAILWFIGVDTTVLLVAIAIAAIYLVGVFLVQNTLQAIFVTELYNFANTGQSQVFDKEHLQDSFKAK